MLPHVPHIFQYIHVVQIFSDTNLFAGMSSDLNTSPAPDPNMYSMGAIPKRSQHLTVQSPPPSTFHQGNVGSLPGNLGALASPPVASSSFPSQSPETTEQLFSAPVQRKFEQDSPLTAIEKATTYSKFICRPIGDNDGNNLQQFLNEKFSRQAYKSNIMGPDTFFGVIAKNIPELAPMDPQKAANDLRRHLTRYIQDNREFCEVS